MKQDNKASLIVKLEGDNFIDVNTLINMLTHYVIITERANDLIGEGAYKSEVKVKALNKGSFEISLEVVATWIQNLFARENITYASTIVAGVSAAFGLYKHFKGKRVTPEEAKTVISNNNDNTVVVQKAETIINLYNDPTTNEAMRKSFETANNDINVRGITIIADGKPSETITEEEFGELVLPKEGQMPGEIIIKDENAILNIVSLSFNRGDNWKFVYQGNKITTKLSNDGLQKAIDQGTSFAKGDALKAELEITQKWDAECRAYVNHRYKVVNVFEHIRVKQQPELFDK
ncbi:MAG: hypothetical protein Q3993_08610 [Filifactor alocis]|nr:hypothetical protein [Filifactor alocis]